jgi:hypothetical protein
MMKRNEGDAARAACGMGQKTSDVNIRPGVCAAIANSMRREMVSGSCNYATPMADVV